MRKVIYYSKVLRAACYSSASGSARSGACDPAVFSPEKISPDSLAAGREHAGWDVCFLQLPFVSLTFPPLAFFFFVFCLIYFHLFIFLYFSDLFSSISLLVCHASAPCPAVEGCRLGPSSVSDKVGLQLAAYNTRSPSHPGLVTPSSAHLLLQSQHRARAEWLQLKNQHLKVKLI